MISEDGWGLSFPDICLTIEEKPRKNLNQENWPDWGSKEINLDLLRWILTGINVLFHIDFNTYRVGKRQRFYPSIIAVIRRRAVAWLVESLPSNPEARVRVPGGSGILIPILGLGVSFVCVLFCLRRRLWHCADHTFSEARSCVSV